MTDHSISLPHSHSGSEKWIEILARVGYATKGVVYAIIGLLAFQAAIGSGGATEGSRGAILEISQQPFGRVLLFATALGLLLYAIWRLIEAAVNPNHRGEGAKGMMYRAGYLVSGLIYLGLSFWAASIFFGWNATGGGGGDSQTTWTAWLLSQPFGPWLVGALGVVIIGVGVVHFYRAYKADFVEKYNHSEMSATELKWAKRIGVLGLSARGVIFIIIGIFLIQAGLQTDPSETRGLGGALQALANQPFGPWLLGIVAAGLVAYGIFCFSRARYSRFPNI